MIRIALRKAASSQVSWFNADTLYDFQDAKQRASLSLRDLFQLRDYGGSSYAAVARQIIERTIAQFHTNKALQLLTILQVPAEVDSAEHCLIAAQLAVHTGLSNRLDAATVQDLGVGCLLSRVGQTEAASRTANQPRQLNRVELIDVTTTPIRTIELLQHVKDVRFGARCVAYQIFERCDGSGYPRGLHGQQINPLARLAGVFDVLTALISPRPHRKAFEPHAAMRELLVETRRGKLDSQAMRLLLKAVGLFPVGSYVRLSDGSMGQVIGTHAERYDLPTVFLLFAPDGQPIHREWRTIEMHDAGDVHVAGIVASDAIRQMVLQADPDYMS